jgi:TonB family protein
VTFRRSQELVWTDATKGLPLFAFDAVQTQKKAKADITLYHQSEIALGPESLIIIDPSSFGRPAHDSTVLRGGDFKGETQGELWILTSAALIQMKAKGKGRPARAVVSVHEGQKLNVQLTEGTGRVFRHTSQSAKYEEIVLEPGRPVVLDAPVATQPLGEKKSDWGPAFSRRRGRPENNLGEPMPPPGSPLESPRNPATETTPEPGSASTTSAPTSSAPAPAPTSTKEATKPTSESTPATPSYASGIVDSDSQEKKIDLIPIESKSIVTKEVHEGLTKEQLQAVIQQHAGEVLYCYKAALIHNPDLEGSMLVSFVVSPSGDVKNPEVKKGTRDAELNRCVLDRLSTFKFPKPTSGEDDRVTYPITFGELER